LKVFVIVLKFVSTIKSNPKKKKMVKKIFFTRIIILKWFLKNRLNYIKNVLYRESCHQTVNTITPNAKMSFVTVPNIVPIGVFICWLRQNCVNLATNSCYDPCNIIKQTANVGKSTLIIVAVHHRVWTHKFYFVFLEVKTFSPSVTSRTHP